MIRQWDKTQRQKYSKKPQTGILLIIQYHRLLNVQWQLFHGYSGRYFSINSTTVSQVKGRMLSKNLISHILT